MPKPFALSPLRLPTRSVASIHRSKTERVQLHDLAVLGSHIPAYLTLVIQSHSVLLSTPNEPQQFLSTPITTLSQLPHACQTVAAFQN